jgi:hypothetical protein
LAPCSEVKLATISVTVNTGKFIPKFTVAGKLLKYILIFVWCSHLSGIVLCNFYLPMSKKVSFTDLKYEQSEINIFWRTETVT